MITHEIIGDDRQAVVLTMAAGDEVRGATWTRGEGLFFASMTGPGRVWIQTRPFSRLADRIIAARRGDREEVKRDFGGALGALGDLIGGDS